MNREQNTMGEDIRKAFKQHAKRTEKDGCTRYGRKYSERGVIIYGNMNYVQLWGANNTVVGRGKIQVTFYNTLVYEYDLVTDTVTDFGKSAYSRSTNRIVQKAHREVGRLLNPHCWERVTYNYSPTTWFIARGLRDAADYHFSTWTNLTYDWWVRAWDIRLRDRMREGAPWLTKEGGNYRVKLCALYRKNHAQYELIWRVLRSDQNWRYVTATWSGDDFVPCFIDDKAKERFLARAKKKGSPDSISALLDKYA